MCLSHRHAVWCSWSVFWLAISACVLGVQAFAALNEHCNTTCHTAQSVCVQVSGQFAGFCACVKGYRATWDGRRCVPERCSLDEHCDLANEVCNTEVARCTCRALHVRAHDSRPCIPPLGHSCTSAGDCLKFVAHSQCLNETCMCKDKFVASHDSTHCLPLVGARCSDNVHCQVKHSLCSDGWCECRRSPARFVAATNNTACLPEVSELRAACSQHNQCVRGSSNLGGVRWCVNQQCVCRFGIMQANTTHCDLRRGLEDSCTHTQQCQTVARALCVGGKCACEPGSSPHPTGTICLSSLHGLCRGNDECFVPDDGEEQKVECRNSSCECKPDFFSSDSLSCSPHSAGSGGSIQEASSFIVLIAIVVVLASSLRCMASAHGER